MKTILKYASVLIILAVSFVFYLSWTLKDSKNYPPLNKCFKASVSAKLLCRRSSDYVALSDVSPYFLEAVVLSEDDKFYMHDGFDWAELRNSVLLNLRKLSFVRGGSTITQQLVKNVYLDHKKSLYRKIKEAIVANEIEKKYSKKLILEKYINAIQYGKNLWGIKSASKHYFNLEPSELGVLESLYLVILLPNPSRYSASYEKAKLTEYQESRIKSLLKRLKQKSIIDEDYMNHLIGKISDFPWRLNFETFPQETLFEDFDVN